MELETLWRRLADLPESAQREVAHLIAALAEQHRRSERAPATRSLHDEPFVGLWKDRTDLADASAWVRRLREQEWRPQRP